MSTRENGFMEGKNLEDKIDQLLHWLWDAENDLGDLARLVETGLARQGLTVQAREANKIAHKWEFRRNRRSVNGAE